MSTNLFTRLKALLPAPPLWVATVLAHNADGTSTVELPTGVPGAAVAPGLTAGATLRVRGTQVAVGERAFIRAGAVESQAPSGAIEEAPLGVVSSQPFGPPRLARGEDIVAPAALVGVAYSLDLAPAWLDGYPPRSYVLTSGTLPPGLALNASSGRITGARTSGAAATGLQVTCTDSTHRALASNIFTIAAS